MARNVFVRIVVFSARTLGASAVAILLAAASGCATTPARPVTTVATPLDDALRICVDHGGFHSGERLQFRRRTCADSPDTKKPICTDMPISSARVVRVLDDKCALVQVALGERIASGDELVR